MTSSYYPNEATRLRQVVLELVARAWFDGAVPEAFDRIPYDIIPGRKAAFRCCVFKEREILRRRTIAALGANIEEITDEHLPISLFAAKALKRTEPPAPPLLNVLDIACDGCIRANYTVTNVCRGCLARPCVVNCPTDAIQVFEHHSVIDEDKCVNCGKCLKVCPYHAIARVSIPCEEACPVDCISRNEDGFERIDHDECIACGRCIRSCPFGAIVIRSQLLDVLRLLGSDRPAIAMPAPAAIGQSTATLEQSVAALKKLGFTAVYEVADGADQACRSEAAEFQEKVLDGEQEFMTTSCCPAYQMTVERHLPELRPWVSHTPSPMELTARQVRKEHPEAATVFIGPCTAKAIEGHYSEAVDYVLTFEEIAAILDAAEINPTEMEGCPPDQTGHREGRGFALTGGVAGAVMSVSQDPDVIRPVYINGLSHKGIRQLRSFTKGKCPGNLVEVMACEGGCINGAGVRENPDKATRAVKKLADATDPINR